MRMIRRTIITVFFHIGIVWLFTTLVLLSGFLLGVVTPHFVVGIIAGLANSVSSSAGAWWLLAICCWAGGIWAVSFLMKTRSHPPITIREDEKGVVEVAPEALCSFARAEIRDQGIAGACRVDYTRKLGAPVLRVWCDLVAAGNGEGPAALGDRLRTHIERRLREQFDLVGLRVAVIHVPQRGRTIAAESRP